MIVTVVTVEGFIVEIACETYASVLLPRVVVLHAQHTRSAPLGQSHTIVVLHGERASIAVAYLLQAEGTISHAADIAGDAGIIRASDI